MGEKGGKGGAGEGQWRLRTCLLSGYSHRVKDSVGRGGTCLQVLSGQVGEDEPGSDLKGEKLVLGPEAAEDHGGQDPANGDLLGHGAQHRDLVRAGGALVERVVEVVVVGAARLGEGHEVLDRDGFAVVIPGERRTCVDAQGGAGHGTLASMGGVVVSVPLHASGWSVESGLL